MPGSFSGNGSVKWSVGVERLKGKPINKLLGGGRYRSEGMDETPPNHFFKVTIKYPRRPEEAAKFLARLEKAAAPGGSALVIYVPIEDVNSDYQPPSDDQILVEWPEPDPNA
jgi:hypothetical protein